ncbi:MAG TPA: Re/Si-specific NAD(P)(+) transhydrogenase subunit alpha [Thermoanaerobaculia bacterium]|nr:Re/Si-specific NAD(P)(+) transhydrogenase subunit alpha [Thermoanaerobaculia bacterium]
MPNVFIPRETQPGETRVAATPDTVRRLLKGGYSVEVEKGAGVSASIDDEAYAAAGASLVEADRWSAADVVLKVAAPTVTEAEKMARGSLLIGFLAPNRNLEVVDALARAHVSSLAMELIPRITKAQPMDALSSQASIAGYKAVILAASKLGKYFPLLMTAAGTISPAKVVVMGAGVAGLQAIATAKRLGAVVEVSDVRAAVKEQVESLGGRFIELPIQESAEGEGGYAREVSEDFLRRQRELVARHVVGADVVITTALVPGKKAPILVNDDMVREMRTGGIIVDLAVEAGGNCSLSEIDQEVVRHGVTIIGHSNLPSTMAEDASVLYARNVAALLLHVREGSRETLDLEDEITRGALLTHEGNVLHEPTAELLKGEPAWARS